MSLQTKAFSLAQKGASNADIWGELEVTSAALQRILGSDPKLLFSILQGRAEYISDLLKQIEAIAAGEEVPFNSYKALTLLLERAEMQNKVLCIAHEMVLLAGQSEKHKTQHDSATVTSLLRASK